MGGAGVSARRVQSLVAGQVAIDSGVVCRVGGKAACGGRVSRRAAPVRALTDPARGHPSGDDLIPRRPELPTGNRDRHRRVPRQAWRPHPRPSDCIAPVSGSDD